MRLLPTCQGLGCWPLVMNGDRASGGSSIRDLSTAQAHGSDDILTQVAAEDAPAALVLSPEAARSRMFSALPPAVRPHRFGRGQRLARSYPSSPILDLPLRKTRVPVHAHTGGRTSYSPHPLQVLWAMQRRPITMENHGWGVTPADFAKSKGASSMFRMLVCTPVHRSISCCRLWAFRACPFSSRHPP